MSYKNLTKYLKYIKVNFFILKKRVVEYKANFFGSIIDQICYFFTQLILFYTIYKNFGDVIQWSFVDFILFYILVDVLRVIAGFIIWGKNLGMMITNGMLNFNLIRPINSFVSVYLENLAGPAIFFLISDLLLLIPILFYLNLNIINIILFVFIIVYLSILLTLFHIFLDSFAFYKVGFGDTLLNIFFPLFDISSEYPGNFLKKFKFNKILWFSPFFFVGILAISILRDYHIDYFLEILIFLILFGIFLTVGILFNWHYGLKKYEGYN